MEFLLAVGVVAAIGWVTHLVWGDATRSIRRALRDARRVAIGKARDARQVKVVGEVIDGPTVMAPISGRRCVYYRVVVHQATGNRKRERAREDGGVRFQIDDGTGRALVDPEGARIAVELDTRTRSGLFDDATAAEEAFLQRHGIGSTGLIFNRTLTYQEGVIEIGDTVAVLGRGVREPDRSATARVAGYRDPPPTRLRLGGSSRHPILICDQP